MLLVGAHQGLGPFIDEGGGKLCGDSGLHIRRTEFPEDADFLLEFIFAMPFKSSWNVPPAVAACQSKSMKNQGES